MKKISELTDKELVRAVAEEVMGWKDSYWCFPGQTRVNGVVF
jgi:hypothetical protein